jgi:WD40 repeat protein
MKLFALLMASVLGTTTLPVVNHLHTWSVDLAGSRIRQDARLKKASFADPVLELEINHERGVTAIAFSPDNKLLATGADDFTIQLWDARTGQAEKRLSETDRDARSPGVYPDGQKVYSLAFFARWENLEELLLTFTGCSQTVRISRSLLCGEGIKRRSAIAALGRTAWGIFH